MSEDAPVTDPVVDDAAVESPPVDESAVAVEQKDETDKADEASSPEEAVASDAAADAPADEAAVESAPAEDAAEEGAAAPEDADKPEEKADEETAKSGEDEAAEEVKEDAPAEDPKPEEPADDEPAAMAEPSPPAEHEGHAPGSSIDCATLRAEMADYVLVDIRRRKFHNKRRIPHTDANIAMETLLELAEEDILNKSLPEVDHHAVVIYDAKGTRGKNVAETLQSVKGGSVMYLFGGIQAWNDAGFPLEKGKEGADVTVYGDDVDDVKEKDDEISAMKVQNDELRNQLKKISKDLDASLAKTEALQKQVASSSSNGNNRKKKKGNKKASSKNEEKTNDVSDEKESEPQRPLRPRPPAASTVSSEGQQLNNALTKIRNYQREIDMLKKKLEDGSNAELVIEVTNLNKDQKRKIKELNMEIRALKTVQKRMDSAFKDPQQERDDMKAAIESAHEEVRVAKLELRKVIKQHETDQHQMRQQQERMIKLNKMAKSANERKEGGSSRTERQLERALGQLKFDLAQAIEEHAAEREKHSQVFERVKFKNSLYKKVCSNLYKQYKDNPKVMENTFGEDKAAEMTEALVTAMRTKAPKAPQFNNYNAAKVRAQQARLPQIVGQNGIKKGQSKSARGYKRQVKKLVPKRPAKAKEAEPPAAAEEAKE